MIGRVKPPSPELAVVFERDGEPPVRIDAPDGRRALTRAIGLLLANDDLRPGDRLTVKPTT